MRVTLAHKVLGSALFAMGVMVAASAGGQTLLQPGGAGDSAAKKQPQMQEIDDAVSFFNKRDIPNAEKKLEEATKKNPDLPPVEFLMAQLFAQAKSGQGMMIYLDKAVQKNPDDPEAYIQLGEIALQQRRITDADLLFAKSAAVLAKFNKRAERKAKLTPRLDNGLAMIAEMREDWPLAQQRLDDYLKLEPKNANVMQRIAKALFQQKKPTEALQKLRDAAKADPDNVLTPEAQLGLFYLQSNNPTMAKKSIGEGLKNAPKDLRTRLVAAQIYLQTGQTGDLDAAKTESTEALKLDPKSLDARMLRGVVALFQKDYTSAESYFEAAMMQSPSNFAASNNLALALVETKEDSKKKRALEYAAENVKKTAKTANETEAVSTYGWILYKMDPVKNLEDADRVLRQAINTGAFNPDTAYYAAVVAAANKRPEEAKALLREALKQTVPWTMKSDAKAMLEQLDK